MLWLIVSIAALRLDSGWPTAAATTSLTDYIISTVRTSLLHSACGFNRELLGHDCLSVLLCSDGDFPHASRTEVAFAFVYPVTLICALNHSFHLGHSHRRHCRHKESGGHFRPRARFACRLGQFGSNFIAAFFCRRGVRCQIHLRVFLPFHRLAFPFSPGT